MTENLMSTSTEEMKLFSQQRKYLHTSVISLLLFETLVVINRN